MTDAQNEPKQRGTPMRKLRDLEQRLTSELDGRAIEYDQSPDFEVFAKRGMQTPSAEVVDAPTITMHRRHRLIPLLAAAVVVAVTVGAAVALGGRDRGAEITAAANDELLYQWPTELPTGWEIIETTLAVGPQNHWEAAGAVAATAPGNRLVSLHVVFDEQPSGNPQAPIETRTINGLDIEVLYVDVYDTFLQWRISGLRFELRTRQVGLDESLRLAAGTLAETDQTSGVLTDLQLPLADDFEILVDQQPWTTNNGSVAFLVACPEVEPGASCGHTVWLSSNQGAAPLDRIEFLGGGGSITTRQTPFGEILMKSYQLGDAEFTHALVVLDNGLILRVDPDMGPLGADPSNAAPSEPGSSPLASADVETILSGLIQIDADTFDELANEIN